MINIKHILADMPYYLGRCLLFLVVLTMAAAMVYHYWYGQNGYYAIKALDDELVNKTQVYHSQIARNAQLVADVNDLKTGLVATEEYARRELGLIKEGETFVQLSAAPVIYSGADDYRETQAIEMVDPTVEDIETQ